MGCAPSRPGTGAAPMAPMMAAASSERPSRTLLVSRVGESSKQVLKHALAIDEVGCRTSVERRQSSARKSAPLIEPVDAAPSTSGYDNFDGESQDGVRDAEGTRVSGTSSGPRRSFLLSDSALHWMAEAENLQEASKENTTEADGASGIAPGPRRALLLADTALHWKAEAENLQGASADSPTEACGASGVASAPRRAVLLSDSVLNWKAEAENLQEASTGGPTEACGASGAASGSGRAVLLSDNVLHWKGEAENLQEASTDGPTEGCGASETASGPRRAFLLSDTALHWKAEAENRQGASTEKTMEASRARQHEHTPLFKDGPVASDDRDEEHGDNEDATPQHHRSF